MYRPDDNIHISQPALVKATIQNASITQANGRSTPYNADEDLSAPTDDDTLIRYNMEKYRQLVGDLRYLADSTGPDLAYVTSKLAAAISKTTTRHWAALKAVIRYLICTPMMGIIFRAAQQRPTNSKRLQGYSDASFAADAADRKSTAGTLLTYNASPIAWMSKKQAIVAMYTTEAEYIALAATAQSVDALNCTLGHMQVQCSARISVKTDNQAARDMVMKPFGTKRRKFIDLRHHYLQDNIARRQLTIMHVPGTEQKADIMTKALRRVLFTEQCRVIGMQNMQPREVE